MTVAAAGGGEVGQMPLPPEKKKKKKKKNLFLKGGFCSQLDSNSGGMKGRARYEPLGYASLLFHFSPAFIWSHESRPFSPWISFKLFFQIVRFSTKSLHSNSYSSTIQFPIDSHQNTRPIRAPLLTTSFWSLEVN